VFEKLLQKKNRDVSSGAGKAGVKLAKDRARANKQRALNEFPSSIIKPAT
jgi:hypothetical protein